MSSARVDTFLNETLSNKNKGLNLFQTPPFQTPPFQSSISSFAGFPGQVTGGERHDVPEREARDTDERPAPAAAAVTDPLAQEGAAGVAGNVSVGNESSGPSSTTNPFLATGAGVFQKMRERRGPTCSCRAHMRCAASGLDASCSLRSLIESFVFRRFRKGSGLALPVGCFCKRQAGRRAGCSGPERGCRQCFSR